MTDAVMNRRMLGSAAVGLAAAAVAAPAVAAPMMHDMDRMARMPMLTQGDWMSQVKAQHQAIDREFQMIKATRDNQMDKRMQHFKMLATLLTGHSITEEVALYPGIAINGDVAGSDRLYMEQQHAKVMVAELDNMPKSGPDFMPRLTALESAIKAHVAEEEGDLYPKLMRQASADMNQKMSTDFRREFTRYMA